MPVFSFFADFTELVARFDARLRAEFLTGVPFPRNNLSPLELAFDQHFHRGLWIAGRCGNQCEASALAPQAFAAAASQILAEMTLPTTPLTR